MVSPRNEHLCFRLMREVMLPRWRDHSEPRHLLNPGLCQRFPAEPLLALQECPLQPSEKSGDAVRVLLSTPHHDMSSFPAWLVENPCETGSGILWMHYEPAMAQGSLPPSQQQPWLISCRSVLLIRQPVFQPLCTVLEIFHPPPMGSFQPIPTVLGLGKPCLLHRSSARPRLCSWLSPRFSPRLCCC